jgi:hypothetical protein
MPSFILGKATIFSTALECLTFILVMCLFILLNLSLLPALFALLVLAFGLFFILMTLLTYFFTWRSQTMTFAMEKLPALVYQNTEGTHLCEIDEFSTLV